MHNFSFLQQLPLIFFCCSYNHLNLACDYSSSIYLASRIKVFTAIQLRWRSLYRLAAVASHADGPELRHGQEKVFSRIILLVLFLNIKYVVDWSKNNFT
jgi:hypothetical protein